MEGEVDAQVAPIFIHQALAGRFCEGLPVNRKRDLPWQNGNFQQQQQQQPWLNSGIPSQSPKNHWNPKVWNWDSVTFTAKPAREMSQELSLGSPEVVVVDTEQRTEGEETMKPLGLRKGSRDEHEENLTLKLGGNAYFSAEAQAVRPNKRVCSGPPGGGGNHSMCQVDDCRADLSKAKDYHRRHKVCELHSKTAKAIVGQQMQRFCQQCSRQAILNC